MCPHLIFKRKSLPYLLLFFLIFSKTNHAQINFNKNYNILKNIVVDSYLEIASNEKRSITYKKLSSIKKDHGFNKIYMFENTKIISNFSDSIIKNSHDYQMDIDLSQSEELIKMNIRKSFK